MPVPSPDRFENDFLGPVPVPSDALFGPNTARALSNFQISGTPLSAYPSLLRSLALIKRAAAQANTSLGELQVDVGEAIARACTEIVEGHHAQHFVIDMIQGGAGTSTNMNMNEVIANRALQIMGLPIGSYAKIHPNDHVNRSQSTNDVYPTALRMAIRADSKALKHALLGLAEAFQQKATQFSAVPKLGRTQLQDAVPMTVGQELGAFATTIREDVLRLEESSFLLAEVNLGGTAIGTGIAASPMFRDAVLARLRSYGEVLIPAENLMEASWDAGAFVTFSGTLKRVAVKLSKISNDLRLLSSGPRGGLGELRLPARQAGSSIMPGKVNPVIPEVVNQVAFQVIGMDLAVTLAAEAGQLQLNAMEPLIGFNILFSLKIMTNAVIALTTLCVRGIEVDGAACKRHLDESAALATALISRIGYDEASRLAKESVLTGRTVRDIYLEWGGNAELVDAAYATQFGSVLT